MIYLERIRMATVKEFLSSNLFYFKWSASMWRWVTQLIESALTLSPSVEVFKRIKLSCEMDVEWLPHKKQLSRLGLFFLEKGWLRWDLIEIYEMASVMGGWIILIAHHLFQYRNQGPLRDPGTSHVQNKRMEGDFHAQWCRHTTPQWRMLRMPKVGSTRNWKST